VVRAYVMIAVEGVDVNKVAKELTNIEEIENVHLIYGEYDIIAEIKAHNPETSTSILKTLKETDGVNTLKTYVVSDQLTDEGLKLSLPPEQNW